MDKGRWGWGKGEGNGEVANTKWHDLVAGHPGQPLMAGDRFRRLFHHSLRNSTGIVMLL